LLPFSRLFRVQESLTKGKRFFLNFANRTWLCYNKRAKFCYYEKEWILVAQNKKDKEKVKKYGAEAIKVLEGLQAVRKRPAMYIGSTSSSGLHHLVYEVVDNSVDEALAGHCTSIKVVLRADGSCSVEDNGRGIPVGKHPVEKISAAEVVMTKLHAGGKFDKGAYRYSGGLHGVGVSVVNALSKWLALEVWKDGKSYTQSYKRGKPDASLKEIGETSKSGTYIRFLADDKIFETTELRFDILAARLRELAFLNKGLRIDISDERNDEDASFFFEGGIVSFVEHINSKKNPIFPKVINFHKDDGTHVIDFAGQYNDGYSEQTFSFVNNIRTIEGGTHEAGFRAALTKACNKAAQRLNMLKGGSLSSDDVREGLVCVLSIKVPEPQFEGQTKTKLGNSEVKGIVDSGLYAFLDSFFEENPAVARKIIQKAVTAQQARAAAKKARELTRRKSVFESSILPGKLADCSEQDASKTEIYIVEGDSAGGSAKQGRDRFTQAVLPLKGKIINVEKARMDRVLSNNEIKDLITAIGAGVSTEFNSEKVRYHKVVIMTDADVDGAHIRILLLTFFFRHMPSLIENGYLYIAQPPLYKVKVGRSERYLKDESEFKKFLFDWAGDNTGLIVGGKPVGGIEWKDILSKLLEYAKEIEKFGQHFEIATSHGHDIVKFLHSIGWEKGKFETSDIVDKLKEYFSDYEITGFCEENLDDENAAEAKTCRNVLTFKENKRTWEIPVKIFDSEETTRALSYYSLIFDLEKSDWILKAGGRLGDIEGLGALSLSSAIVKAGKSLMTIQRYKGLGEMNPEQLWETTMDPEKRTLLRVSVEDALKADQWFASLMGDVVQDRRDYIERHAHFVRNLDV